MTKIAITGATGHLGGGVMRHLLAEGADPATLSPVVRSEEKAAPLRERGLDPRVGSYDDPTALAETLRDVDKIVLISPPTLDNRHRLTQLGGAAAALSELDLEQLVFVGLADPERRPFGLEDVDIAVEQILRAVNAPFTFMRNGVYLDELTPELRAAAASGVLVSATDSRPLNWVRRDDLAAATAAVLRSDEHLGQTYELVNEALFDYDQLAAVLSDLVGRPIAHRAVQPDEAVTQLTASGLGAEKAEQMVHGFHAPVARGLFDTTSTAVRDLTGRSTAIDMPVLGSIVDVNM